MYRFVTTASICGWVILQTAAGAFAHVTLEQREARAGAPLKATLRVPHGCDGAATLKVTVQIPEGLIAVKPMPKAGWQLDTVKGAYGKSYPYHGAQVSEGVKEISWSGRLADDYYDEFIFSGFLAAALPAGRLPVPVIQKCETGEARWVEIPAAGQDAHALKAPAPSLVILAQHAGPSDAQQPTAVGALSIATPWIRATPGGAKVAGGYLTITNRGKEADRLTGGSLPVADRVEVHEMAMEGGVMKMRALPKGLAIAPGESVELKPGGYHLMFMDLKQGLKEGDTVKGTLVFEKAGKVDVEYKIGPIGGGAPKAGAHSHR